jgi:hypothetical protein
LIRVRSHLPHISASSWHLVTTSMSSRVAFGLRRLQEHHPGELGVLRGQVQLAQVRHQDQPGGLAAPDDLCAPTAYGLQHARRGVEVVRCRLGAIPLGEGRERLEVFRAAPGEGVPRW